jgi:integrase
MSTMATIQKRRNKNGTHSYRVMIRQSDGFPPASKTFPSFQEAKDWGIQEEAYRRQGCYFPMKDKAKHTLAELVDRYIAIILPTKPKDARNAKRQLEWWKSKLGKHALQTLTPDLIARYRQELLSGLTNKGSKRSPATVNRYLAILSTVMTYAVRECGWISDNPCLRVTKFQESKGRDRVLSKEECDRLLDACLKSRNEYLLLIVFLAITTGMRQGEILGLSWRCIDFDHSIITLKETKNGRPRTVSIVGKALQLFHEHHLKRNPFTDFVFPAKKRFGQISIRKAWDEALKRARIKGLHFHDLRHTFATYAAEAGASNIELATAMGHQTLQMLQRYTHMNATITHRLSTAVHQKLISRGSPHET